MNKPPEIFSNTESPTNVRAKPPYNGDHWGGGGLLSMHGLCKTLLI